MMYWIMARGRVAIPMVEDALRAIQTPAKISSEAAIQDAYDPLDQDTIKKAVKRWPQSAAKGTEVGGGYIERHFTAE